MTRHRIFSFALVAVLLAATLPLAGCPKGAYHDAVVAEHDFTTALASFQSAVKVEAQSGRIDAAENKLLEDGIGKVGQATQVLVVSLQAGAANTTVQQNFATVVTAVGDLLNVGVLGVKNPQSQGTLKTALVVAQDILNNSLTLMKGGTQ